MSNPVKTLLRPAYHKGRGYSYAGQDFVTGVVQQARQRFHHRDWKASTNHVAASVRRNGYWVGPVEILGLGAFERSARLQKVADNCLALLDTPQYSSGWPPVYFNADPSSEEYRVLESAEPLKDVLSNFFEGQWQLQGIIHRADAPRPESGTDFWHRDSEDTRMLKLFWSPNGISLAAGPTTVLPPWALSPKTLETLEKERHFGVGDYTTWLTDDELAELAPRELWATVEAQPGEAVLLDTRCLHRGSPRTTSRYVLSPCWTTFAPLFPRLCKQYWNPAKRVDDHVG